MNKMKEFTIREMSKSATVYIKDSILDWIEIDNGREGGGLEPTEKNVEYILQLFEYSDDVIEFYTTLRKEAFNSRLPSVKQMLARHGIKELNKLRAEVCNIDLRIKQLKEKKEELESEIRRYV